MKYSNFLMALLLVVLLFSGCIAKEKAPVTTEPPAKESEIPETATISDAETINEPNFAANETVDLGSII